MNMTKWIMICLLAVALAPSGCSKKDTTPPIGTQAQVTLDVPKLRSAFASANPDLKAMADAAIKNIEFGRSYANGLADLERLAGAADLTDDQKKVVAAVTEQVKQLMGGGAGAPAK
jgi:hypothetical protein